MAQTKHHEIVGLGPVLLRRQDLFVLEKTILDGLSPRPEWPPILCIEDGSVEVSASSVQELLEHPLPACTDSLRFTVSSWAGNEIDASVEIRLHRNHGAVQLSADNRTLFLGKRAALLEYFRDHRPWYARIKRAFPFLNGALITGAAIGGGTALREGETWLGLLLVALFASSLVFGYMEGRQRVFPFVRVLFGQSKTRPPALELVVAACAVLTVIIAVIALFF